MSTSTGSRSWAWGLLFAFTAVVPAVRSSGAEDRPIATVRAASPALPAPRVESPTEGQPSDLCFDRFRSVLENAVSGEVWKAEWIPSAKLEQKEETREESTTESPTSQPAKSKKSSEKVTRSKTETKVTPQRGDREPWLTRLERYAPHVPVRVVIATLPDPIDSGLGYQFDAMLQAVRLGMERPVGNQSWSRDLAWLPWEETIEAKRKEAEECRREMPGLVVFRAGDRDEVGVLLLVGETPTSGVQRLAMSRALQIAETLAGPSTKEPVKILGPTFSGGADSLRAALLAWRSRDLANQEDDEARRVLIVSGSATGSNVRRALASQPGEGGWLGNTTVEFWSTTVPEEVLQCRYLRYIQSRHQGDVNETVAFLHESGTQFGQGGGDRQDEDACRAIVNEEVVPLRPAVSASFPAGISALREAYEKMEDAAPARIARRTSLEVSLSEKRTPGGVDAHPGPKTTFARDVAVSRLLARLGGGSVRHVAIQATDVADAIFLARKIEDVAPDIRVAFMSADTLLIHPDFRAALSGSLVVTPYPFLGSSNFIGEAQKESLSRNLEPRQIQGLENSDALGVLNALLALRGANMSELIEYESTQLGPNQDPEHRKNGEDYSALPVWISAIGSGRFIPLAILPSVLSTKSRPTSPIFPGWDDAASSLESERWLAAQVGPDDDAAVTFQDLRTPIERLHAGELWLARDATLPRAWRILPLLMALWFVLDQFVLTRSRKTLRTERTPDVIDPQDDRLIDRAMIRVKILLYGAVRTTVLYGMLLYMSSWAVDDLRANQSGSVSNEHVWPLILNVIRVLGGVWTFFVLVSFLREWAGLLRVKSNGDGLRWNFRWGLFLGFARAESGVAAVRLSQGQVRTLVVLLLIVGTTLFGLHIEARLHAREIAGLDSQMAMSLLTARSRSLVGGVSPAAPTLCSLLIFYVWSIGRTARLRLTYGLSLIAPCDGVPDFVCTPIRMVLYPFHNSVNECDDAFTRIERSAINAILRPTTGLYYTGALVILFMLPFLVFLGNGVTTLERHFHAPLIALLYLSVIVVAATMVQMFQHWCALDVLLKNVLHHRLGRAFKSVAPFVRESLDEQVSRTPNDMLRLAACAVEFDDLVRLSSRQTVVRLTSEEREALEATLVRVVERRSRALATSSSRFKADAMRDEGELGEAVILAAQQVMKIVVREGNDADRFRPVNESLKPVDPTKKKDADNVDEPLWLDKAEAFGATVVAILLNRHVRQLQYFVYPLLTCAVLLMVAVMSYPFEPNRLMMTCSWIVVLISVFGALWTYVELDRNSLLSRIAQSGSGQVTFDRGLVFRVLTWGVAPLLAAMATEYPDLMNVLFRLVAPFGQGP